MTTVLNNHSDDKQQEKLEKCKKLLSLRSAPLASFEDLPTDEQNSSTSHSSDDDDNEEKHQQQQRPESSSSGQQTLQSSSQITVLITDHDDDGSGGDRIHSAAASIINDDGASSLSPKLPKANQRKGSWTDIFFGRKSPTIIPTKERKFSLLSFKFSFKDDNKQQQCELTPMTVIDSRRKTPSPPVIIDCGIQLTPTNHSNIDDLFSITTTTSNNTIVFIHENPEGSSSIIESKTELPITKQQPSQESDCDSLCSLCQHNDDKLPSFYHENNTTDDQTECSECEICCENDRIANNNNESTDMDMIADYEDNNDDDDDKQINNNNDNHLKLDSSYDSYELEMLVKNDELDLNRKFHYHHSNDDYKIKEFNDTSPNNRRPSLGKNLEENFQSKKLPTLSIERPHSIVPVTNIEKFEAYLDKFSIKNNNEIEMKTDDSSKLKIILPVDITKSSRYSRKSNPFIWLQFCEQGLKSPKILRKRAKSCFPSLTPQFFFNSFTDLNNDNDDDLKASSPGNLTPITPLKNLDMVDGDDIFRNDHFEPKINFKKSKMKNQSMNSECTCSCATTTTTTTPLTSPTITMTTNNLVSLTTATTIDSETNICLEMTSEDESMIEQSDRSKKNSTMVELIGEDQPLLVSPCDCICHHHQIISSSTTKKEFATKIKIQDKKKNVESKNVEKQMTSDEITSSDLCLISSSSSTTLSSSSTSSSSSSTSSSVSSPSSSISPSSSST